MAKKRQQTGKKGGSVIDEELKDPAPKNKPAKHKKTSKGKHKK
ncbi:MAG: hypothetical protein QHH26_13075 [Armatimonadota bacterium]|nr:hypothetical protein [Armatimonadota bacterium]